MREVCHPDTPRLEPKLRALPLGKMSDAYGATFALPAVGEKGYFDVRIEVATKGGHSSIPPPHTVGFCQIHSYQVYQTCF